MAGGVDEGDLLTVLFDLVGADMLGDATGFASDHVCLTNGVEQRGLAVVDVTHDRHDRRTGNHLACVVGLVEDAFFNVGFGNALDGMAEFDRDQFRQIGVDHVARLHHLAFLHQELDDVDGAFGHALRQFLNGNGLRQDHFAHDLFTGFLHLAAAEFFLAAAHGCHGAATRRSVFIQIGRGNGQLAATAFFFRLQAGSGLGRNRSRDLAASRKAATAARTTIVLVVTTGTTSARSDGVRRGRSRTGSGGCRLRTGVGSWRRCCGRSRRFIGRFGFCFSGRLACSHLCSRCLFDGAACRLFLFGCDALFFLDLAARFIFRALLGFHHVTSLRFHQRAATGFHLAC
ncbi:hypothetical protein D3C80_763190 [compost metagenome]